MLKVYWGRNICNRKLGCMSSLTHFNASCLVKQINNYLVMLWDRFAKLRKTTFKLRHVCLSVRPHRTARPPPHWSVFHEILYLRFFENLSIKLKFYWHLKLITGTLHEDRCTFLIIYFLLFCWPCISIYLFININRLDALNFIISLFEASTCFEHMCLSSGRQKLYYTVSGIITPIGGCPVHRCARDGHL